MATLLTGASLSCFPRSTKLTQAVRSGDLKQVQTLVGAVDPDERGVEGWTPLTLAIAHDHYEIAKVLLDGGASVNKKRGLWWIADDAPPLMMAARSDREPLFDLLLERGADVRASDWSKGTVLMRAAQNGNAAMLGKLLAGGADVHARNRRGQTALLFTCLDSDPDGRLADNMALLLEHGARVDVRDELGATALNLASGQGSSRRVTMLLAAGADVNAQNDVGWSPLHSAAGRGDLELIRLLLEAGADPTLPARDTRTPFHVARDLEAAALLREATAERGQ